MDLYPLRGAPGPPDLAREAAESYVRRVTDPFAEPLTVAEILAAASAQMDREDRLAALARDPLLYLGVPRRRGLLGRLLGR